MGPGRIIGDAYYGGDLMPTIDNVQSIGSSSLRWKNIYAASLYGNLSGNATTATKANTATDRFGIAYYDSTDGKFASTLHGNANTALMGKGNAEPEFVNVTPSISITDGTADDAPKVNLTVLGVSGQTAAAITKATTGLWGVIKLSNTSSTTEEGVAATPKGVWAAIGTLNYTTSAASGTDIAFVTIVDQSAGQIVTSRKTVRDASAEQSGVVSTGVQTFAGNKSFNGITTFNNNTITTGIATFNGNVIMNSAASVDALTAGNLIVSGNTSLINVINTATILPHTHNTYNIGADGNKYLGIYATNFYGNATTATKANITSSVYGIAYYTDTNGTFASTAQGAANTALMGKGAAAPGFVSVSPGISITDGTADNAPKINVTVLGISGTAQSLTKATTGLWGVIKLSSTSSSSEEGLAATPKGVWAAINTLDVDAVGVAAGTGNRFISQISEADGKISATLATATIGGSTQPIWIDSGTIKNTAYSLSSSVNAGTTNRLAYYSDNNIIAKHDNLITGTQITYGSRTLTPTLRINNALYVDTNIESGSYFLVNKADAGASYYLYSNNISYGRLYVETIGKAGTATTFTNPDDSSQTVTGYTGNVCGTALLVLGNNIACGSNGSKYSSPGTAGNANNAQGYLRLYSSSTGYGQLTAFTLSDKTFIHASTGISLAENRVGIMFRPGLSGYYTCASYQTSGNEALVFSSQNTMTSFIFVNGENYTNIASDRFYVLDGSGASGHGQAPGLQIKQNCVSIGKLIGNGVNATYKLQVYGGKVLLNNNTASSTTNLTSQLIVSNENGGNVAIELWRNTGASWQLANESGTLCLRNNYTTAKQNTYSQNGMFMDYNTCNVAFTGCVSIGQVTRNTSYNLYVNGTSYFNGNVTHNGIIYVGQFTIGGAADVADRRISSASTFYINRANATSIIFQQNAVNKIRIDTNDTLRPEVDSTLALGDSSYRWSNIWTNMIHVSGPSSDPSANAGARIEFTYDSNTSHLKPVYLAYTPNDSYRAPAGLKVLGGTDATPAWLEVEGSLYTGSSIYITKNSGCGTEVDNQQTTNPNKGFFGVGSSGNLGIYSRKHSKWVVSCGADGVVSLNGNANTATKFASAQTITLTGDTTGTASSQAGWNITTKTTALSKLANADAATLDAWRGGGIAQRNVGALDDYVDKGLAKNDGIFINIPWSSNYGQQIYIDDNSHRIAHRYLNGVNADTGVPNWSSWKMIVSSTGNAAQGNTTQPVYVDANGQIQICTTYANASVNYATNSGNATTANTAGTFTSAATVELTGDTTGSASSTKNWSIATSTKKISYDTTISNADTLNEFLSANKLRVAIESFQRTDDNASSYPGITNGILISGGYTSTTYGFQLIIDDDPGHYIALRQKSTNWSAWKRIPMGDGTGASGTWGISISGNAATATKATQDGSGNVITSKYVTLDTTQTISGSKTFSAATTINANATIRQIVLPAYGGAYGTGGQAYIWYNGTSGVTQSGEPTNRVRCSNDFQASKVYNAIWNDYAECRQADITEPGFCITETMTGIMTKTTNRLMPGCKIISDTYGTCMGETVLAKTPIAVAGRVLAYPYRAISEYHLGDAVCSAPNGTIDIMTREEIMMYPERIVGTVSEIPTYKIWYGGEKDNSQPIEVKGRVWIYVR